ncbi:MAG: GTP 3',8-cyclase MoaA [Arenicellales bacterium]
MLLDQLNRPIHDLRISVTDRCNFRCGYCMPKEVYDNHQFLKRSELLSFEEIEQIARVYVGLGVVKIRLTGGEPLARKELEVLISMLNAIEGLEEVSLTTNASLLTPKRARALRKAGLSRINISLDALDQTTFGQLNGIDYPVDKVLAGIENACAAGFENIKVNMVVQKGINENSILPMVNYFIGKNIVLRFIEFMDVGNSNQWDKSQVFGAQQIKNLIASEHRIESIDPNYLGEVAKRWRLVGSDLELGIISSVTEPFCRDCSRARLSAIGEIYTCLFSNKGHDLREILRTDNSAALLQETIENIWHKREDRYSELRATLAPNTQKVEMSYIGG